MALTTFYDLLGVSGAADPDAAAAAIWPRSRIKSTTGFSIAADPTDLVLYLQSTLMFRAIRPGASPKQVGLSAEVVVKNPPAPMIRPLVLTQMPDVAFYLQDTPGAPDMSGYRPARLYVNQASTGVEIVIEGLPVEIRLPVGLLEPLRKKGDTAVSDVTLTDPFQAGVYDSFQVTLSETMESSIFVHIRLRMTEEMDFIIEPAVPISFGPCRFSGLPCHGVHDLNFVPAPILTGDHSKGEQALEWTRHDLDRLSPDAEFSGVLTVRTLDLDSSRQPLKKLSELMNKGRSSDAKVEFVLEDLAVPFFGYTALPIPSHGLFGLRRKIEAGDSPDEAYKFAGAPVSIKLGDWRLLIDEFLLKSPASLSPLDQFIFLKMALLFGSKTDTSHAATFRVTDEWTLQGGWQHPTGLTLFTIADVALKLWGAKVGWSLKRFTSDDPDYDWYEQLQLLVDLGLSTKGSSLGKSFFKMRSLSGKDLEVVLRDVGYSFGEFSLEGLSFPEGVQFIVFEVFRLIVEELGWVTENSGARYFSFSGGVSLFFGGGQANRQPKVGAGSAAIRDEKGKGGGIRFRRLRFRTSDSPAGPPWLLDGISLSLKWGTFEITGFGLVSEFTLAGHQYKEFGFGIKVSFDAIGKKFLIGMQLFYGRVEGPTDNFKYWMFGFQYSPIPIGSFELVNIRFLLVGNMMPNLPAADGNGQNMRLFRWYKNSGDGAITLPSNRKAAGWVRKDDALAFGAGVGLSLPVGKVVVIDLFVFYHKSPDENGLLVAIEAYILKSPKPVGYGALEFDFKRDKWGFMLGVTMNVGSLFGGPSIPFLGDLVSLTGTLYAGNKPGTFALGQLNDQSTWLSFRFKADAFVEIDVLVGFCIQVVDTPQGPKGFGFVFSAKGGASFGIGKIQLYAGFGFVVGSWGNEATVTGFTTWIELGLRIKVFWIFNFGASVRAEFDFLGREPKYSRLACIVRIETPWFMPDVTFRFEKIWSKPKPELMAAVSTPLTSASAIDAGARTQKEAGLTPITGGQIQERSVYSVAQLRTFTPQSLSNNQLNQLELVSVDSVVAVNFKPGVDDKLVVGENTPAGAGTQQSNDLKVTYELTEASIRRKLRFGSGAGSWTTLLAPEDTQLKNPADFPPGFDIEAHFTSSVSFLWDRDLLKEGRLDPRRLLINSETPYTFVTSNPEADESTARSEPGWPCCPAPQKEPADWHELHFKDTPFGVRAPSSQRFSESSSSLHWSGSLPPLIVSPQVAPPPWHAARINFADRADGIFASIQFDEAIYALEVYAYWLAGNTLGGIVLEAYKGLNQVSKLTLTLGNNNPTLPITVKASHGFTAVLFRTVKNLEGIDEDFPPRREWIELIRMRYRSLAAEIEQFARDEKCKARGKSSLSGAGKLAWLPNHDYEIKLKTRVILNHTSADSQDIHTTQKVYFRTKGLPGLNAVDRTGDELEPYVESSYPGSTPRVLYRAESVLIAFNEKFNNLLPVDRIPSPDKPDELNQILEWVLAVEKVGSALERERISKTSPDWVVANRTTPPPSYVIMDGVIDSTLAAAFNRQAPSFDPPKIRLQTMILNSVTCGKVPPSLSSSQILTHKPRDLQIEAGDPQRWQPNAAYRVNVRQKDGPFVERNPFDDNDFTAFDVANEGGGTGKAWRVTNGAMHVQGTPTAGTRHYAVFGESGWNHVQILAEIDPQGGQAGLAVSVAGLPAVNQALLVLIDDNTGHLRILARRGGVTTELASKAIPSGETKPYALQLFAFDDEIRARVGDTEVKAARGDLREGLLALVSRNGGIFHSLVVEALDAYRFDFLSSRFIDFANHIKSFSGDTTTLAKDAAGTGAATGTVAALLSSTSSKIDQVMKSGADPEERQRLFDKWVGDLALPLRRKVTGLEMSRLTDASGDTELILLESPEPLPFSEDVSLTLKERKFVPSGCLPSFFTGVLKLASPAVKRFAPELPPLLAPKGSAELVALADRLNFVDGKVAGSIGEESSDFLAASPSRLIRAVDSDGNRQYEVYDVTMHRSGRGQSHMSGELAEVIYREDNTRRSTPMVKSLDQLERDELVLADDQGRMVTGPFRPTYKTIYVDVSVKILTNAAETRALIIPLNASNALKPLPKNIYRFQFKIDRARYRSQTPNTTSNYQAQTMLVVDW